VTRHEQDRPNSILRLINYVVVQEQLEFETEFQLGSINKVWYAVIILYKLLNYSWDAERKDLVDAFK
jgi:hypothetical protein